MAARRYRSEGDESPRNEATSAPPTMLAIQLPPTISPKTRFGLAHMEHVPREVPHHEIRQVDQRLEPEREQEDEPTRLRRTQSQPKDHGHMRPGTRG